MPFNKGPPSLRRTLIWLVAATVMVAFALSAWFDFWNRVLFDPLDRGMLADALLLACGFVVLRVVEASMRKRSYRMLVRYFSNVIAMMTTGFAMGAMIELSLQSARAWSGSMPYEGRAYAVALAVFTIGCSILAKRLPKIESSGP